MDSLNFQCLLTNAAFPAKTYLTAENIVVEINEFQCEFRMLSDYQEVNNYSIQYSPINLHYSKLNKVLSFSCNLKELIFSGKSQLHELTLNIEKHISNFMFHTNIISNNLESVISELSGQYQISLQQLTHESSTVVIKTRSYGDIILKTYVKNNNIIAISSKLLTSRLFEHYFEMKRILDLREVYENLAISAEFQLILDDSLKEFSRQSLKLYNPGSYSMPGIMCTGNFYNEIHLCYMKNIMICYVPKI